MLRDPDRFEVWGQEARRPCLLRRGHASPDVGGERADPAGRRAAGPDEIVSIADRDALDRAFRRLTVEQRAVFVLHHHLGLPLVEIAETLGVPAGTARSRRDQARFDALVTAAMSIIESFTFR